MNEGRRLITISADGEPSGNPLSFIGLSTDIKPTTGIPKGSSFTEIDTSKIYHFDGSSWVEFNYRVTQFYNETADSYEELKGRNGANFVEILGPNGETLSVVSNKLAVRATEIETLLNTLNAKDFATETKLEAARALLASLDSKDYSTETTLAALKAIFDSGDAKVTLNGSIVQNVNRRYKETVFSRAIRDSSETPQILTIPTGAIGCVITCKVYGVTGSFATGEGLNIKCRTYDYNGLSFDTEKGNTQGYYSVFWYPNADIADGTPYGTTQNKNAKIPLTEKIWVSLGITGTFAVGEGFDSELFIEWLY